MLPEYKNKAYIGVGIGFIIEVIGRVIAMEIPALLLIGSIITLVGFVIFIWGCMNYAEGKGYSKWLGLLGILSCIGLIVLVVIPDQNKSAS